MSQISLSLSDPSSSALLHAETRRSLNSSVVPGTVGTLRPPEGPVRTWSRTRCTVSADYIKAQSTGFNREPLSSAVSGTLIENVEEVEIEIDTLRSGLCIGVVKLAADARDKKGMSALPQDDSRDDKKWRASPCANWRDEEKVGHNAFMTEKGLLMKGNRAALRPGWQMCRDHGIRWGDTVSCSEGVGVNAMPGLLVQPLPPLSVASRGLGVIDKVHKGEQYCTVRHLPPPLEEAVDEGDSSQPAADDRGTPEPARCAEDGGETHAAGAKCATWKEIIVMPMTLLAVNPSDCVCPVRIRL